MSARYFRLKYFQLKLANIISTFVTGHAAQPSDIEGKWSWKQGPWYGDFVLKKNGGSFTGTLDNVFKGTYGDKISDVEVSKNRIKFTRYGRCGVQYWEGTLALEDDRLKIIDGLWRKEVSDISCCFSAEKKD